MATGQNAKKNGHVGRDYWGKRLNSGKPVSDRPGNNKITKRATAKAERRDGKAEAETDSLVLEK